jgi:acyl-CoA thioester hydrolase
VQPTTIRVRWGDLDPYNHVNHAVYSTYLEQARVETLESLATGMDALMSTGIQIVVVRSDIRFRSPAVAGDELVISSRLGELRVASMTWNQQIDRGPTRIVDAEITAATVDRDGRPVRIPRDLRAALSTLA